MIEIKNGIKFYDEQIALNNINLSLSNNGLVVICGDSGSGKTSLLNCIGGIDHLTSGEVINCSKNDVSFIFQDYALIDELSIKDNLQIAYDISDKSLSIDEILKIVNLEENIDKKINELSGGQKQRVAIARSLITNRSIIIADEPTGNLDKNNAHIIAELLKRISINHLVIIVTHNLPLFKKYADRIIMLEDGEVIKDETVQAKKDLEIGFNTINPILTYKSVFKMFKTMAKNAKSKYVLGILIEILVTICILLTINIGLETKSNILVNWVKSSNVSVVNFSQYDSKSDMYVNFNEDTYDDLNKMNIEYMKFYKQPFKCTFLDQEKEINYFYENKSLNDNEIVVSYEFGQYISKNIGVDNIENIIGKKVSINNYEFTIKGYDNFISVPLLNAISEYSYEQFENEIEYCYMNQETYIKMVDNSLNYEQIENGIAIRQNKLTKNIVEKLMSKDILNNFYMTENLNETTSILSLITKILFLTLIPIVFIMVMYLINFANQNIINKKREIGILKSLSFSNKQIAKLFIIDSMVLILFTAIFIIFLMPLTVGIFNSIFCNGLSIGAPIEYKPVYVILMIIILIGVFFVTVYVSLFRLNKKADVDLVYGR